MGVNVVASNFKREGVQGVIVDGSPLLSGADTDDFARLSCSRRTRDPISSMAPRGSSEATDPVRLRQGGIWLFCDGLPCSYLRYRVLCNADMDGLGRETPKDLGERGEEINAQSSQVRWAFWQWKQARFAFFFFGPSRPLRW